MKAGATKALVLAAACLLLGLGGCGGGGADGSPSAPNPRAAGDTGAGVGGGEQSIERFGEEAGGIERDRLVAAFRAYFEEIATRNYVAACSHVSRQLERSIAEVAGRGANCAESLDAVLSPNAARVANEFAGGKIEKVRVEGGQAFVVYRAPGAELYQAGLIDEGGDWNLTSISGSVLVPRLSESG